MSSILTNTGAMVALQTLKSVNSNLSTTQNEISTGKSVATAKDNAAVWAISKVMDSDVKGFKGISDGLSLGMSSVAVGRIAAEKITDHLTDIKGKIVAAQEEGMDRTKIQTDISALRDQISSVVNAAQFSGLNIVKGTDAVEVLASLDRDSSGNVTASKISVARQDLTTSAGVYNTGGTSLNANATASAANVANTGNSAEVTFNAGDYDTAGLMARLTVGGVQIDFEGATGLTQDDAASFFEGAINALQLEGITASSTGGALTVTSTRGFEGTNVAVSNLTGDAAGTEITDLNGTAVNVASGSIEERAQNVTFSSTSAVQNGDGYRVAVGSQTFDYVAGPGQNFEDVSKGLKAAIDAAGMEGITTRVTQDENGAWQLKIDNSGASVGMSAIGNAGGEASGGLFGLDGIDVTTEEGARAALDNIEQMIGRAIDSAASFGSSQGRLESQNSFVGKLVDSLRSGIGTLVDADMEETSARLQALQVQQQLAVQSLSIANQAPQNILSLFR